MIIECQPHQRRDQGNKNRQYVGLTILAVALIQLLLGCALPTVETETLMPARSQEMTGIHRLAILDFIGPGGPELSRDIEAALVGIRVQDRPYFTIVDRETLYDVVHEMQLGQRQIINSKTATQVGKLIGAEAVVMGTIQETIIDDDVYTEERQACADKKCRRRYTYTAVCTKREAVFAFTPKVVRVDTGRIVTSEQIHGKKLRRACQGDRPLDSGTTMLRQARQQALDAFAQLVAPHYVEQRLAVISKDNTKPSDAAKSQLKAGVKWANEGRMDRACPAWKTAYELHPHGYALPYNLGLCAEVAGRLQEARDYYAEADRRTSRPVYEITTALERVDARGAQQKHLRQQLSSVEPNAVNRQAEMVQAQRRLAKRGYDPGAADGIPGPRTSRAIEAFQKDHGLPVNGSLDARTKAALGL